MRNHSYEYDFDLHENGRAGDTYFHTNGFDIEVKSNPEMVYFAAL